MDSRRGKPASHRRRADHDRLRSVAAHGSAADDGEPGGGQPAPFFRARQFFEANLWGDESPIARTPPVETDLWYSFSSTFELLREFLGALMRNAGNDPAIAEGLSARWVQPTDQVRLGRLLVLTFSLELPITDEPWVQIQVTGSVDVEMVFPDGSSSDVVVVVP